MIGLSDKSRRAEFVVLIVASLLTVVLFGIAFSSADVETTESAPVRQLPTELATAELLKRARTAPVCLELLRRGDVDSPTLRAALIRLARLRGQTQAATLKTLVLAADADDSLPSLQVFSRLVENDPEFHAIADELADAGSDLLVRQLGLAMQIAVSGDGENVFAEAKHDSAELKILLQSLRFVGSQKLQAGLYTHLRPLLLSSPEAPDSDAEQLAALAISVALQLHGQDRQKALDLLELLKQGRREAVAISGFLQIAPEFWPNTDLGRLAALVTAWIAETPSEQRSSDVVLRAFKLGRMLMELFPTRERERLRQRLEQLSPQ